MTKKKKVMPTQAKKHLTSAKNTTPNQTEVFQGESWDKTHIGQIVRWRITRTPRLEENYGKHKTQETLPKERQMCAASVQQIINLNCVCVCVGGRQCLRTTMFLTPRDTSTTLWTPLNKNTSFLSSVQTSSVAVDTSSVTQWSIVTTSDKNSTHRVQKFPTTHLFAHVALKCPEGWARGRHQPMPECHLCVC